MLVETHYPTKWIRTRNQNFIGRMGRWTGMPTRRLHSPHFRLRNPLPFFFHRNKMAGETRSLEHPTLKVLESWRWCDFTRLTALSVQNAMWTMHINPLGAVRVTEQEVPRRPKVPWPWHHLCVEWYSRAERPGREERRCGRGGSGEDVRHHVGEVVVTKEKSETVWGGVVGSVLSRLVVKGTESFLFL